MPVTTLKHPSGSSCQIDSFGATVISFQTADQQEHLFVSKDAKLDGSKAIRGGIPIVFPIFGPSPEGSTMPQHGFGRVNHWTLVTEDASTTAVYTLQLADVTKGRGEHNPWSVEEAATNGINVTLKYTVELSDERALVTTLEATNTGTLPFDMQALLHNYFTVANQAAHDATQTNVTGLDGYRKYDKVGAPGTTEFPPQPAGQAVSVAGETDTEFYPPSSSSSLAVTLHTPGRQLALTSSCSTSGVSCVVWNPGKDKAAAMSDMNDDAYDNFICVEPGVLREQTIALAPQQVASLTQTIRVE